METFLRDYEGGRRTRRYVEGELPTLPFADDAFDLALCSHFLFLYTKQLAADFHAAAVRELCRVAREVGIFPLLALGNAPSPQVAIVSDALRRDRHDVAMETVPYEFQRGGNGMLRIRMPHV
jgi:ubiquinone/menaquinone biosynthesis C-methylase UbiE